VRWGLVSTSSICNWCSASALRLGNESRGGEDAAALLLSHCCLGSIAVWITGRDWDWDDSCCAQTTTGPLVDAGAPPLAFSPEVSAPELAVAAAEAAFSV
jgi:hypothetical protein